MVAKLIDDCFRPSDSDRGGIPHDEAIAALKSRMTPIVGETEVRLDDLIGRTLAEHVTATDPVPPSANSAVDGFAFASPTETEASDAPLRLQLAGVAAAGHVLGHAVPPGSAARILTGAVIPLGCDTVAMQEDCQVGEGVVTIPRGLKRGANIRRAGEDVDRGSVIFVPGHVIRPQDLAALSSIGRDRALCFERVRVAILSTGDELIAAGAGPLGPGQIFEANAAMMAALARTAGAEATYVGTIADNPDDVRRALSEAATTYDIVLTSGGASRGSEDHMAAALADLGSRYHWTINIKPGRPIMFGQIGRSVVVGLPGNPVAVFVCFLLYVWPMLRVLGGAKWPEATRFSLPAGFTFQKRKTGRREYWRGWLDLEDGKLVAQKFPRDGSGLISGLRASTGLIEIPEDRGDIARGDLVDFIPYSEFGIPGPLTN